ncbi:MAG: hypothetical protein AB1403_25235, partial [Candidatus Riflebacteria bacterium]
MSKDTIVQGVDSDKKRSLLWLIFTAHRNSSFLPVLFTASILIGLFFWGNSYLTNIYKTTLLQQVKESFSQLVRTEAEKIDLQLNQITDLTAFIQDDNTRFFLASESFPLPADEPVFAVASNGVMYKTIDNGGCSLFYSRLTKIGPAELKKSRETEVFDPLYRATVKNNPLIVAVYFNSFDHLNRYYPFIPDVVAQYDPDLRMQDYNFYYLADAEHNPEKKPVWTGAYLDPAGLGWMVSCIAPIYNRDFLEGVIGLDITIEVFVKNILNMHLPFNASAFLIDKNGMILAMSEKVEAYLGLKELKEHVYSSQIDKERLKPEDYNLSRHPDGELAKKFASMEKGNLPFIDVARENGEAIIFQHPIKETEWRLMIVVERKEIFVPVNAVEDTGRRLGYLVLLIIIFSCAVFYLMISSRSKAFAASLSKPIV